MTNVERRGAVRVRVLPRRVRVDRDEGYLIDLSEGGALVRLGRAQHPDRIVLVNLDVEPERISLTARVVRCTAHPIALDGAVLNRTEYCVAFEFRGCDARERLRLRSLMGHEPSVRAARTQASHCA